MKTIECAFLDMYEQICFVRSDATKFVVDESAYSLEATFPLLSEKAIDDSMMIGFSDIDYNYQIYKIINKQEDPFGKSVEVYAEHAGMIELIGETIIDKRPTKTSAGLATQIALEGTRWQLRTAENVGTQSCRFWYCSVWEALQKISSVWGCALQFAWEINDTGVVARYVTVRERQGEWRGKRFELSKGITGLKIKTDASTVVTALFGRGKGEELSSEDGDAYYGRRISFADVEWSTENGDPANKPLGQEWVEDQAASAAFGFAGRKRCQVINFDDCEDPEELLDLTWAALQQLKMPKITVRGTVVDLENAWGYGFEAMRMGDTTSVVIDEVNLEAYIDVTSIKRNYIYPEKTSINLGNVVKNITDLQADYNSLLQQAAQNAMLGAQVATANPSLLKGIVDTMVTQILSSGTDMYTDPNDGSLIFVNALGNAAVRITGNGILISNKKIEGEWQWNTAIAGNGIVADVITSGTLQANLVRILGTTQFYWDAANICIIDPTDSNRQIRIGAYNGTNLGIGYTQDGGATWSNAIGFNGLNVVGYVTVDSLGANGSTNIDGGRITTGTVKAERLELTGVLKAEDVGANGSTTINGSLIKTGTVAAERIDVNNLYVKHLNSADGTFTGTVTAGNWRFDSQGSLFSSGNQQVLMQVSGGSAKYTTNNLSALYGSTSYNETRVYGGAVVLDCSSTGQSVSARNGQWGSYSYSDVCFVCDQAGSSYDSAKGNLGTTDNRWDILWCDTVHYRTRASDSSREVKHDIAPLPDFGAKIDQLKPVKYKYKDDKRQQTRYGLIYEDTIELIPDVCHKTQEGGKTFRGISYEDLIAVLIGEVKELRKRVSALEKKLAEG